MKSRSKSCPCPVREKDLKLDFAQLFEDAINKQALASLQASAESRIKHSFNSRRCALSPVAAAIPMRSQAHRDLEEALMSDVRRQLGAGQATACTQPTPEPISIEAIRQKVRDLYAYVPPRRTREELIALIDLTRRALSYDELSYDDRRKATQFLADLKRELVSHTSGAFRPSAVPVILNPDTVPAAVAWSTIRPMVSTSMPTVIV